MNFKKIKLNDPNWEGNSIPDKFPLIPTRKMIEPIPEYYDKEGGENLSRIPIPEELNPESNIS